MPPKKGGASKTEDVVDVAVAPEGDDDRILTITVSGAQSRRLMSARTAERSEDGTASMTSGSADNFVPILNSPSMVLTLPHLDANVASVLGAPDGGVVAGEALGPSNRAFAQQLFARKVVVTPAVVSQLFGGVFRLAVQSAPEGSAPPALAPAKGAKKGDKGKGKAEAPGTARSENDPQSEALTHLTFQFTLADVLTSGSRKEFKFTDDNQNAVHGFDELSISIACNAPLLSPSNVLRYPAAIIEVASVNNLPPQTPIDVLKHRQDTTVRLAATDTVTLQKQFEPVQVSYSWTAGLRAEFATQRVPHDTGAVKFAHKAVVFLHQAPRLALLQGLFAQPLVFEVHDRDAIDAAPGASPFGVARVSLRDALDGTVRFIDSTQVVPSRRAVAATLPDYYSFGTVLHTKILMTTPLPFATFVDRAPGNMEDSLGATAPPSEGKAKDAPQHCVKFLSRVVLVMPYKATVTAHLIRAVMGVVMEQPRPTLDCDVSEVAPRPPTPPPAEAEPAAKGGKKGKAADAQAAEAEAPPPPPPTVHHPAGGKRMQVQVAVPDNVSGFEIMDGDIRIIIIEGQLPFVTRVAEVAATVAGSDPAVRILFNYELPFLQRLYHMWPPLVVPISPPTPDTVAPNEGELPQTPSTTTKAKAPAPPKGKAPPAGGKAPKVPPIPQPGATEPKEAPAVQMTSGSDAGELDAGGVGGRIRRIRLKHTLTDLFTKQAHYIRRALTPDALLCVHRLMQLRKADTIVHAVDHDHFPSNQEIISLERVGGDCLDTYDVCAADAFYNFGETNVDDAVAHAVQLQLEAMEDKSGEVPVDLEDLGNPDFMGRVVSFVALPASPDDVRKLPSLKHVQRYHSKGYLRTVPEGKHVRCAFSMPVPTQLLRFQVTGQVVGDGCGGGILYVMSCVSLAKKGTDSRNPAFAAKKRREEHMLPASHYFTQRREAQHAHAACHTQADPRHRPYQDTSSDDEDGFEDPPPKGSTHVHGSDGNDIVRDAQTHHVELNKRRLAQLSTVSRVKKNEATAQELARYDEATRLHDEFLRKERERAEALERLRPDDSRPSFTTIKHRSAIEDARPNASVSEARADDLKAPWEPPQPSLFLNKGGVAEKPLRYHGAKTLLGDPLQVDSVFNENAVDKLEREEAERRAAKEAWAQKVVVDDVKFKVACKQPGEKPHVIDKHKSLLEGEPKKASLRRVKLEPPPVSIRQAEKLAPNERVERNTTKHPERRRFYYARDAHERIPQIPGMDDGEKQGPLWYERPTFRDE